MRTRCGMDRHCGDCKYLGAEIVGRKIKGKPLHICNSDKSIFRECAEKATGCNKFEKYTMGDDHD